MIGIDIVKISRIRNISHLKKKILSSKEQYLYAQAYNKKEFIAGRFAAKEAFLKAKHLGIKDIPLNEIQVLYDISCNPLINYQNQIYDVSITHDGDYAIAVVCIIEKSE